MEKHSGIRIDKIPVEGWAGLIFVAGILAISFVGHPTTRWFLLISFVSGVIGGGILYLWRKR
jgi:hypothetical protein